MRGHEYVRDAVKTHLAATVGPRLSVLRAALEVNTPPNPGSKSYLLADSLPVDPNLYPVVVVMSTGSPRVTRQSVSAAGDTTDFIAVYDIQVVVACRTDVAGGEEAASRDRDRLLLAVREALLSPANLPDDLELVTGDLREDTGAAAQDLRGRPLAAGQVNFAAAVLETLAPITAPDAIEESAIDVTGYGQDVTSLEN